MKLLIASLTLLSLTGIVWAEEVDDSYEKLKEASQNKDAAAVKKLAVETSKLARELAAKPQPVDAGEVELWKKRVQYAKEVDTFCEYSLYSIAAGDAANLVDFGDALVDLNPKSQYVSQLAGQYLTALGKQGSAKQLAAANKIIAGNPNVEEAFLTAASAQMGSAPDRAIQNANRLTALMRSKAKPEGYSDADWEKKKSAMLGQGYYISGAASCGRQSWIDCDKSLRAALPYMKDGNVLFYLGLANYQLGKATGDRSRISEGQKFSEQSAAMPGPMQAQAQRNALVIKQELAAPVRAR